MVVPNITYFLDIYKNNVLEEVKEKINSSTKLDYSKRRRLLAQVDIAQRLNVGLCVRDSELKKLRKKLFAKKKILKDMYKERLHILDTGYIDSKEKREVSIEDTTNVLLDYLVQIKAYDIFLELFSDNKIIVKAKLGEEKQYIYVENYFKGISDCINYDSWEFMNYIMRSYDSDIEKQVRMVGVNVPVSSLASAVFIRSLLTYMIDEARLKKILAKRLLLVKGISGVKMKEEDLAYILLDVLEKNYGVEFIHCFCND